MSAHQNAEMASDADTDWLISLWFIASILLYSEPAMPA